MWDEDILTPVETGGAPTVVTSNNWWDLASQTIKSVADVQLARIASSTRAAPQGNIATNASNPPPGGFGLRPQANSSPGGAIDQARQGAMFAQMPAWAWGIGALLLALGVIALARR